MIIQKTLISEKTTKGITKKNYEYSLNADYWKEQPKPLHVCIDEAHHVINSRKSQSASNIIASEWLALIRRVTNSPLEEGELVLISQFLHKLDVNAREMCTQIRYFIMWYFAGCATCHKQWKENTEIPKDLRKDFCPYCGRHTRKQCHVIEARHFMSFEE